MKTLNAVLISSILPVLALLTSCGEKRGEEGDAEAKTPPASESEEYPKFVREWTGANGQEQADGASSIAYNPETRALIEEHFRKMVGSSGQTKASFTMELDSERSLEFRPESDSLNHQQEFLAIWTQPGPTIAGATSAMVKRSRPIPSVEEALGLLHLFVKNNGDIQAAVEWEE